MKTRPFIRLYIDNSNFIADCPDIREYEKFKRHYKNRINKTELIILNSAETLEEIGHEND